MFEQYKKTYTGIVKTFENKTKNLKKRGSNKLKQKLSFYLIKKLVLW